MYSAMISEMLHLAEQGSTAFPSAAKAFGVVEEALIVWDL